MPTISFTLVIFDGVKVTPNTKTLVFNRVIFIYIPNSLDEGIYGRTLRLANVFYEGLIFMKIKVKRKPKIYNINFIKILVMLTLPM